MDVNRKVYASHLFVSVLYFSAVYNDCKKDKKERSKEKREEAWKKQEDKKKKREREKKETLRYKVKRET